MPAPSQLAISTSALQRLVKEEASYHKELEKQEAHLQKTQGAADEDGNKEYQVRQEQQGIEETRAVFPTLRLRIADSLEKLRDQIKRTQEDPESASEEELAKAKEAVAATEKTLAA